MTHAPYRRRAVRGFTLIELMIVVVVVALLAVVALPSFQDSMRKSRRTEAFTAVSAVQQAQERWRSNNAAYTTNLTAAATATPAGLGLASTTSSGLYTIAIPDASATGYTVTATAVSGTSQAKDGNCVKMAARVAGGQIEYAGCATCTTFTFAATNDCWKR